MNQEKKHPETKVRSRRSRDFKFPANRLSRLKLTFCTSRITRQGINSRSLSSHSSQQDYVPTGQEFQSLKMDLSYDAGT